MPSPSRTCDKYLTFLSSSCRQTSFFHDVSKDLGTKAAETLSKNNMAEMLERTEENPRQFKYLWAVFDSSKDSTVHDEVEARDKPGEEVVTTPQIADHDSSNAVPTKESSQGQESRKSISEATHQPEIKSNTTARSYESLWYCCVCGNGPLSRIITPSCPSCGHECCYYCQSEW